jgi:hypothetical protein
MVHLNPKIAHLAKQRAAEAINRGGAVMTVIALRRVNHNVPTGGRDLELGEDLAPRVVFIPAAHELADDVLSPHQPTGLVHKETVPTLADPQGVRRGIRFSGGGPWRVRNGSDMCSRFQFGCGRLHRRRLARQRRFNLRPRLGKGRVQARPKGPRRRRQRRNCANAQRRQSRDGRPPVFRRLAHRLRCDQQMTQRPQHQQRQRQQHGGRPPRLALRAGQGLRTGELADG